MFRNYIRTLVFPKDKSALRLAVILVGLGLATGCTSAQRPQWLQKLIVSTGLISDRPTPDPFFFTIIKFQSPALLATATRDASGQVLIDSDALKAVQAEQAQAEAEIRKLSDQIKIVYRYKMVLNAFAVFGPAEFGDKIAQIGNVASLHRSENFDRPEIQQLAAPNRADNFEEANSAKWIGASALHKQNIRGQKTKVGVIDTGIDYTHAMLGGPGTAAAYASVQPSSASLLFPNKKVVGGYDFVGSQFNAASADFEKHVPAPDSNPIDEAGHGTHVAGTIAGTGDGVNSYDGVAPDADLYALKVFGSDGSTNDVVVIAALEYAADPKATGTGEGKMDVVNLSLGSSYGSPHILYGEAIRNLTLGGTVVVASAGNNGNQDYITGAPAVADDAISVAANVDNTAHNWKFDAIRFSTPGLGNILAIPVEGTVSKSVSEVGNLEGILVPVGLADEDFSLELAAQVQGKVAFIDRGKVSFADKIRRAVQAGAIGVVVANNQPGEPFAMGGNGRFEIPAVMISQALGDTLKAEIRTGNVVVHFQTPEKIERPELIDTIAEFSSKGPRTQDSGFKPEITAPGSNVISAAMGEGNQSVQLSGTSMAGPHVAGVMALLRQRHPQLTVAELKAMAMGRSVLVKDASKNLYPLSRQGAGRVQVDQAASSPIVASKASLSLGEVSVEKRKKIRQSLSLKNLTQEKQEFQIEFRSDSGLSYQGPTSLSIAQGTSQTLNFNLILDSQKMKASVLEMDAFLLFKKGSEEVYRIPILAMAHKISQIHASDLKIESTSSADATGSAASLKLKNSGTHSGRVLLFNSLGADERKSNPKKDPFKNRGCDLQTAGYRLVERQVDGSPQRILQIAAKLYEPMTTWNNCELSVLIDSDGDDVADQELAFVPLGNVQGLAGPQDKNETASLLLDAKKAREIRKAFEQSLHQPKSTAAPFSEDYTPALLEKTNSQVYNNSTLILVEVSASSLAQTSLGELAIKIATLHNEGSSLEGDDYLADGQKSWKKISMESGSQSFVDLPEEVLLEPGSEKQIEFSAGEARGDLLVLMPDNRPSNSNVELDAQSMTLSPGFAIP